MHSIVIYSLQRFFLYYFEFFKVLSLILNIVKKMPPANDNPIGIPAQTPVT